MLGSSAINCQYILRWHVRLKIMAGRKDILPSLPESMQNPSDFCLHLRDGSMGNCVLLIYPAMENQALAEYFFKGSRIHSCSLGLYRIQHLDPCINNVGQKVKN